MSWRKTNEYIQTASGIVAIVGIFLLGYEVRQGNNAALSERVSVVLLSFAEANGDHVDAGISAAKAKAMNDPLSLTQEEKMDLDWHHWQIIRTWHQASASLSNLDIDREFFQERIRQVIMHRAPSEFGSSFSRAWLTENRDGIAEFIFEPIMTALEAEPGRPDIEYFRRIDQNISEIESAIN